MCIYGRFGASFILMNTSPRRSRAGRCPMFHARKRSEASLGSENVSSVNSRPWWGNSQMAWTPALPKRMRHVVRSMGLASENASHARTARLEPASTESATGRAKPSAPWDRIRSSPRRSRLLMADSTAGCRLRAATNSAVDSYSRVACDSLPFPGRPTNSRLSSSRNLTVTGFRGNDGWSSVSSYGRTAIPAPAPESAPA